MPSAKYKEIEEQLLFDIKKGKYAEGALIPKEVDLAQELGVSRPTVRHAIANLVADGYLERRKKRGTIVKRTQIKQEFTHVIENFNDEIKNNGQKPKTKVLAFKKIIAPAEIQKALNLEKDVTVYQLKRLRFANKEPVVMVTTYLPVKHLEELAKVDFNHTSLYQELDKLGLSISHVKRKLEVRKATAEQGKLLQIKENDPVFYFHTIGSTKQDKKLEYSIATYRGDNNYFMIEIDQKR